MCGDRPHTFTLHISFTSSHHTHTLTPPHHTIYTLTSHIPFTPSCLHTIHTLTPHTYTINTLTPHQFTPSQQYAHHPNTHTSHTTDCPHPHTTPAPHLTLATLLPPAPPTLGATPPSEGGLSAQHHIQCDPQTPEVTLLIVGEYIPQESFDNFRSHEFS